MNIPENLKATTKNGLELAFEFNLNCKPHGSNKWVYHQINAYTIVKKEKVNVGFLRIAYISEEKYKENSSDIIEYLIKNNKVRLENKNTNTHNITIDDMKKLSGRSVWSEDINDKEIIDYFKTIVKIKYLDNYESYLRYHYLKPESDFVEIAEDYKRNGVGIELYKIAAEFCNKNGLNLYQSTTQTKEAELLWECIKKSFDNCNSYDYTVKDGLTKKRFYIGTEKPILKLKSGLENITTNKIKNKSNKINSI